MTDRTESTNGSAKPEDRIENALDRIAYALYHRRGSQLEPLDWQPLAANVNALRLRVRDIIDRLGDEVEG